MALQCMHLAIECAKEIKKLLKKKKEKEEKKCSHACSADAETKT